MARRLASALAPAAVAVAATILLMLALPVTGAAGDPPGNNGTVKIDGDDIEGTPDNDPHPGCRFTLEFAGYDKGDLNASVIFELQPPTLRLLGDQVLLTDTVPIGEDEAGGAGDLDASRAYDLDFTGVIPDLQQGYHVKVTVHADGSQGADTKHKVFWVSPCTIVLPTTTTSTTTTSTTTTSTTVAPTSTAAPTTTVAPTTTAAVGVGGVQITSPTTRPVEVLGVEHERLPRTGPSTVRLLMAVGAVLMLLGDAVFLGLRLTAPREG